jgi:N-acetylglucosamine-6-sulfatase
MTDDQENATLRYMPQTRALIAHQGVRFNDAQASFTLCCPSRATFLTGQYAHNHGVLGDSAPAGGWYKFNKDGKEAADLPVALQRAGYNTALIGKYLNGWGSDSPISKPPPPPPGWTQFYGGVGRTVYSMWGFTIAHNGHAHTYPNDPSNPAAYQTNVLTNLATRQIRRFAGRRRPFMVSVFPAVPHYEENPAVRRGFIRPAPRYRGAFPGLQLRRTPSFNERDVSDKPPYIRQRPLLTPRLITKLTRQNRGRVQSLLSVDDMVGRIVAELRRTGQLANTVIVFTSDNGFVQGQHRIFHGKIVPYGDSPRIPLIFRGPGFLRNAKSRAVVANIDLAPTLLRLAHAEPLIPPDGISLLPLLEGKTTSTGRDLLLEDLDKTSVGEEGTGGGHYEPYQAVRTSRWLYVDYTDPRQGVELYDLRTDPDNLHNLAYDPRFAGIRLRLRRRLDAIRNCAAASCRRGRAFP